MDLQVKSLSIVGGKDVKDFMKRIVLHILTWMLGGREIKTIVVKNVFWYCALFKKSLKHFVLSAGHYHFKEEQLIENIFVRRGYFMSTQYHQSTRLKRDPSKSCNLYRKDEQGYPFLSDDQLKKNTWSLKTAHTTVMLKVVEAASEGTQTKQNRFSSLVFGRKGE